MARCYLEWFPVFSIKQNKAKLLFNSLNHTISA
uniref:Uncharacterized protein n=1 Tax=Siphoviridae sp. ct2u94 TaxID=2826277 RepID=A0A8S5QVC4_9CAUD|nr:MAG TPA: hypothetical protein [Siphoviridae sp. ct2u94]